MFFQIIVTVGLRMPLINTNSGFFPARYRKRWYRFWMRQSSWSRTGRLAMRLASITAPPDMESIPLAYINKNGWGYISPTARLHHHALELGKNNFIGDNLVILQRKGGGKIRLGDKVSLYKNCILETGQEGEILLGDQASIHHNSILKAYLSPIEIGSGVMIAANCTLYSYNHEIALGTPMREQPICSKGGIKIGDEAWLGTGVVVLDGAHIGKGAVIGAGSVVTGHIPDNAIAVGNPAKVVKQRK